MEKIEWKVDDWCFCEYKLQQIMEVDENGDVRDVSDGNFRHSGYLTDRCYPVDMKVKRISEHVSYWRDKFHKLNHNSLNMPDINRALVDKWCEMCDNREDLEKWKELGANLDDFCEKIVAKVNGVKDDTVEGVMIFR